MPRDCNCNRDRDCNCKHQSNSFETSQCFKEQCFPDQCFQNSCHNPCQNSCHNPCQNPCQQQCNITCDPSKIVVANPNICCAPTICKQCTTVQTCVLNVIQPTPPAVNIGTFSFFAHVNCEACKNLVISWPLSVIVQSIVSRLPAPGGPYTATVILNLLGNSCNPCFPQPTNSFSYVITSLVKTTTGATGVAQAMNGTTPVGTPIQFTLLNGVFTTVGNFTPTVNVPISSGGCNCCNICCVTLAFTPGTTNINPCLPTLCCGNGVGFF